MKTRYGRKGLVRGRKRKKRDNRFVRSLLVALVSSSHFRGWVEGGEKLEIRGVRFLDSYIGVIRGGSLWRCGGFSDSIFSGTIRLLLDR